MRILVHPVDPVALFILTPYDMSLNYHHIQDFLFLMEWQGDVGLRNKLLALNDIHNITLNNSPFSPNTELRFTFGSRDTMLLYLKGEIPINREQELKELNEQLKEFFDARDREIKASQPPDYTII